MIRNIKLITLVDVIQQALIPKRLKHTGHYLELPKPGGGKSFRRIVHYPKEYTVQPLKVTNLAGRDPVSGRVVAKGIGGGIKHKYHWIQWIRNGTLEGPPLEEKVIQILKCGCRTSHIALVATGDTVKYILATQNMKAGDIIKSSRFVPMNPVKANEGDCYPLGALPIGTVVHNVQVHPNREVTLVHSAGSYAKIKGVQGDKILVQMPNKNEYAFEKECLATVGRLSNVEHSSTPIGSAQANRLLGNRPRSGLWQRKGGRHGRKLKPHPGLKVLTDHEAERSRMVHPIRCTIPYYMKLEYREPTCGRYCATASYSSSDVIITINYMNKANWSRMITDSRLNASPITALLRLRYKSLLISYKSIKV